MIRPNKNEKQLTGAFALNTTKITVEQCSRVKRIIASKFSLRSRQTCQLEKSIGFAKSQDEWMDIALKIDALQGNDVWRSQWKSRLYEVERLKGRIDEFVDLIRRRDIFDLMFTLRGGISRNQFSLLHEGLFSKAMAGTKILVETYHNVICTALNFVCDAPVLPGEDPIPTETRLAFFNETRHAYGRTALLLSGGAALAIYHVGVVKTLIENGLMPRVLSGASGGSIVGALVGTRTDEEVLRDLVNLKGTVAKGHSGMLQYDFFRPMEEKGPSGVLGNVKNAFLSFVPSGLRKTTSLFINIVTGYTFPTDILKQDTKHFQDCCRICIGNFTFKEAFDRTGRILNITVSPLNRSDPPRLLNYLTAPHILVWSASVASASPPGVFEPSKLLIKSADGSHRYESATGLKFLDGSMEADLPMEQLSEMFNVNHFIVSQANAHAFTFSSIKKSIWTNKFVGVSRGVLRFVKNQLKAWFHNVVTFIGGRRIAPHWETRRDFFIQFFTQNYVGRDTDITLNPWSGHKSVLSAWMHLLHNPSRDEFMSWILAGQRETWRCIPRIKSHCAVEMTLDKGVQRLRKKLLTDSWKVRQQHKMTIEQMVSGVPSFPMSENLINTNEQSVGSEQALERKGEQIHLSLDKKGDQVDGLLATPEQSDLSLDVKLGWGGMGLKGSHSYTSLARSPSHMSGLFVMDSEDELEIDDPQNIDHARTTTMASFYYRNSKN
eukprot:CAMPEP_0195507382 /NCGR_PEP_ID=MMETSP0794_2-20130614/844_1 /TAXON_ID=515487 /ORGANISM="Stephanopyxis turris, Strain CCMP 815" /LENGTH=718 /DNA_ID=CAMNT_0040634043 /DNA_START=368 /DNA_END=2524 /DNA_ORIENTATION=+